MDPVPQPATRRRRYDENEDVGPKTKDGLPGRLESAMQVIFWKHCPKDIQQPKRQGWRRLSKNVAEAMRKRGGKRCDEHSHILKFIKGYAGCSMPMPVVIALADALGLSGKTHATFVHYGAMLRGREDTRAVLYQYLVDAGSIPATENVERLWEKRP